MSKKNKHGRQPSGAALLEIAKRDLSKGDAKNALKAAKECYRESPNPEARQVLELAYARRVEQLQSMRLSVEARTVLASLIELRPTTPEVLARLPRLQVIVGDAAVDAAAVFAQDPALLASLVDQAVLDSQRVAPSFADCQSQVAAVREALAAVERSDDAAAIARLEGIGRQSPLADWKLFVRGLIAFYQADRQRTEQNWQRLEAPRAAYRISRTLLVAAGDEIAENVAFDVAATVRSLHRRLEPQGLIESLGRLAVLWRGESGSPFFREYRDFRQRFGATHGEVLQKVVDVIWKRAARDGDPSILQDLTRIGPAPKLDPRWNRARAMIEERSEYGDKDAIEDLWKQYADDLRQLEGLRDAERSLAIGLTYLRIARTYVRVADRLDTPDRFGFLRRDDPAQFRERAATFFRHGIDACPPLAAAYRELADLHESAEEPQKAAIVFEKLLKHFPDDFDAHHWLAQHYLDEDKPAKSEPHVQAVERLKPRDERCATLRWNLRLVMIRGLAKQKQYDAARQELAAAVHHMPPNMEPYTCDTIAASIEYKAKNAAAAERHLQAALAKTDDSTPIWLQMSCAAARYGLAREIKKGFDDRFKQAIAQSLPSATLGRIARFLFSGRVNKVNYTGRATQEKLFLENLKSFRAMSWNEQDLRDVCWFVTALPKEYRLRNTLVGGAVRQFPNSPFFQWWAGDVEMEKGPWEADVDKGAKHLKQALELSGADPSFTEDLRVEVRRKLSAVEDLREQTRGSFGSWDDEESEFKSDAESFDDDDDFFPLDGNSVDERDEAEMLEAMARGMPADIRKSVEQMARQRGGDMKEVLQEMIRMIMTADRTTSGGTDRSPTGRRPKRQR